ncbi:MAG: hypothetical protein D6712_02445 [Chloroflexi bacterium]|nr:MAG: hypothetical protein D6712_02445 [Chloroflexota bacterium]
MLTKNFQTTTILYYTFFLPGVVLHEVVVWLTAGVLDVRAERAIEWPEQQEIGELRLNFVQISRRAGPIKTAIINSAPIIVGLAVVSIIANNIFRINEALSIMSTGDLDDVSRGIQFLISAPDFWLWFYIAFTIINTMIPSNPSQLSGWKRIAGMAGVILIVLLVLGIGGQIFAAIASPIQETLGTIANILLLMISINLFTTLVLGFIEAVIEHITGHSATFRKGKMITMTREELLQMREQERKRAQQRRTARAQRDTGPPSIYKLPLPIPEGPNKESVTTPPTAIIGSGHTSSARPTLDRRPHVEKLAADGDETQGNQEGLLEQRSRPSLLGGGIASGKTPAFGAPTKPEEEEEAEKD